MNWSEIFTSSVGKKLVMAITGLFLITFLVIHVGLNACIFANDNGEMFNVAAHFMGSHWVIRAMEFVLFGGFLVHIIQGFALEFKNRSRRKQKYAIDLGNRGSKWYSRSMGLLGTLLLLFLIMHIGHFWVPSRITGLEEVPGEKYHNLFAKMVDVFQNPIIVVLYVLGCISLAYHLMHGFQSAFRTLGVHNNRYVALLRGLGNGFSIIISLLFASMPIAFYFGLVH
ncbi:MAG TPA: succinate dehydrogenase cytochrome b subunit [Flavitalea sp.]|nr:succinate dehydrogenase cytochrome b subunit [Flavitalea sp.]